MKTLLQRGTKVGGFLLRDYLSAIVWFFCAMVAVFLAAQIMFSSAGVESYDGPNGVAWAPRYFLGVVGVVILARIEVYIAHGYTRREMLMGSAILGLVFSLASVAILLLWGVARRAVFEVDTWSAFAASMENESIASILLFGLAAIAFQLAYFFTGLLLGASFRRLGRGRFLALMVPMAAPVLLVEMLGTNTEHPGTLHELMFPYSVTDPVIAVAAFALLVVPVAVSIYTLRGMPLRSC